MRALASPSAPEPVLEAAPGASIVALVDQMVKTRYARGSLDGIGIYVLDLTGPLGFRLCFALHAANRGPNPGGYFGPSSGRTPRLRPTYFVGAGCVEDLAGIVARAGDPFAPAAKALLHKPPAHEVRVLVAGGDAAVVRLALAERP